MIKVSATRLSGLTFHEMLAMIQDDVSGLLELVCDDEANIGSDVEMLLDEVAEKLALVSAQVERDSEC